MVAELLLTGLVVAGLVAAGRVVAGLGNWVRAKVETQLDRKFIYGLVARAAPERGSAARHH